MENPQEKKGLGGDAGEVHIFARKIRGDGKILADGGGGSVGGRGGKVNLVTEENEFTGEISARGGKSSGVEKYTKEVKDLPIWLKYLVALATIFGAVFGGWGVYIVLTSPSSEPATPNPIFENATSTTDISEILSKALSYKTVVERQDFLSKYIGDHVRGEGVIDQVSRAGDSFLIDIKVDQQTITCPQESNEENEKQLVLAKGKKAYFVGVFPFSEVYGHGLGIDDCTLEIIE